jgi:hypothetical protein
MIPPRAGDIAARIKSFHASRDFMSSHIQARATFFTGSRLAPGVNLIIVISLAIVLWCAARPAVPFAGADATDAAWTKTSASVAESAR